MPLSDVTVDRNPIHTRSVECRSYSRGDGLWDIEGHLTDVKTYPFLNSFRGEVVLGEPLHDMWIRLTVNREFIVQKVEAVTDAGPYALCPAILPSFQKLNGLKIGAGWNRRVRERLGGALGCAHLVDMLKPIATVAFHTVRWSDSAPNYDVADEQQNPHKVSRPPVNTCHVWASDGELIRNEHADFYTGE